ncbi:MAG: hypothetical protein A2X36_11305 [Elusimicrobia bacterium GWA2_69_24]|nr:MAG: hypothetical protein A2X36_11305 [Elusimicrobia bacterium GWA2_69_24]HBL17780.1 hypothetical protein [Elusimicrobiota bacterium]
MLAKHGEEEGESAVWAITYGDLMSFLMIFFLFLYAFAVQDDQKKQELAEVMQETLGDKKAKDPKPQLPLEVQAAEALKDRFEDSKLTAVAEVETDKLFVRITLKEKVLFKSGRAELLPEAAAVIHQFALVGKGLDNDIMIEGHTDNVRPGKHLPYKTNWELSFARAHSIVKYLVDQEDFSPARLAAVGYGEFRPLAPNDSPEQRALNRRIQITIIRKPAWAPVPPKPAPAPAPIPAHH